MHPLLSLTPTNPGLLKTETKHFSSLQTLSLIPVSTYFEHDLMNMTPDTSFQPEFGTPLFTNTKTPLVDNYPNLSLYRPLEPPNRNDWETFKGIIVHKYVDMNTPLHEIKRDMESSFGFKATQRMYKQRFSDWRIFKYPKAAEKHLAKVQPKASQQKMNEEDSAIMSRMPSTATYATHAPSVTDWDDISTLWPDALDTVCDQSAKCAHRHCIQAFLFQLQSFYNAASQSNKVDIHHSFLSDSPQQNGSVEKVLYYVRQFSQSRMLPGVEDSHQHHITEAAAKAAQITSGIIGHCSHRSSPKQCERCTWAEFDFGLAMLEEQHTDLALASFELGCRLAHLLLSSPSKLFIRNLIMAFGSTRWEKFEPFRRKLLEYLALMASVELGDKHPITIILENVACGNTLAASAEASLRIMLELFEEATYSAHPDVLLIKRSLSVILRRQHDYTMSESILLSAIHDSEAYNGYDCKETRRCLRRLGHLYMEQRRYSEAEAVFQRILDTAPGKSEQQQNWRPDEISVYTYQHLARMSNDMGDRSKCRYWFMKEMDAAIKRWGVGGDYTAECLQLAYNEIPPDSLQSVVDKYPEILNQAQIINQKGGMVISKGRWCAVRNLI